MSSIKALNLVTKNGEEEFESACSSTYEDGNKMTSNYSMDSPIASALNNNLVLLAIFKHLNLRELRRFSLVSRDWKSAAKRVEENRLHHLFHVFYLFKSEGHRRRKVAEEAHLIGEQVKSFIGKTFLDLESTVTNAICDQMKVEPKVAFMFQGNFCPHSRNLRKLMQFSTFGRLLPPKCRLIHVTSTAGLIGSPSSSPVPIEAQSQFSPMVGVSFLFLSEMKGVDVRVFHEYDSFDEYFSGNDSGDKLNNLKCLLIFASTCTNDDDDDGYKSFENVDRLIAAKNGKVALGGLIIDEVQYVEENVAPPKRNSQLEDMFGVAISGPRVKSCSLLLTTDNAKATEAKLREFRNNLDFNPDSTTESQTVAFMFVCSGRGSNTYDVSNTEATLFRKIFPNATLIGAFGHGEYGQNYWPNMKLSSESKRSYRFENSPPDTGYWHFYTTILVMINFPRQ